MPFEAQWERYLAPSIHLGDVFVNGGRYGGACQFDGANGAERWCAELPFYDLWTPAVDETYVYAYLGENAPGLYALQRETGSLAFMIPDTHFDWDGWSMKTAPVLTHDGDVIATQNGRLIRFDVHGRRIEWEIDRNFLGQATVKGDVIYVNDGGTLTAWNALDGTFLWTWFGAGGEAMTGNIVVTDTHVFVQSASSTYAINLSSRNVDWSHPASGDIAIGDGVLAIVDDTTLHVFSIVDPSAAVPPTELMATSVAGNQLTFRFMPPTGGAVPTGYILEGGVSPGQTLVSLPLAAVPEHMIVVPSGAFYARVRTVAGAAVSDPSNEIRIFTNQAVPPSAPTSMTGLVFGSNVRLAWKNTFQGGTVERVLVDVAGPITTSLVLGPVETFAFNGVPQGTYTFSVRARNAAGTSVPSAFVSLNFPHVSNTCSMGLQTPAAFIAYRVGNVVRLSWDPPTSGGAPTGYRVTVTGAMSGAFDVTGRSLSGAVGPGSYNIAVAATGPCGLGPSTSVQTVVVP